MKVWLASGASCLWLHAACTVLRLPKRVLSFSHCLILCWPPRNGDHHTLISHFTGVNSPFSTASAGSPHSPSSPLPHPGAPPLACVRSDVVYWTEHLEGLAFHRGSCWHHVPPSRAAGRRHAGQRFTHPPASPLRTPLPPVAPRLALVEASSLDRISYTSLM